VALSVSIKGFSSLLQDTTKNKRANKLRAEILENIMVKNLDDKQNSKITCFIADAKMQLFLTPTKCFLPTVGK
jgi:catabolite regulation protein CreA